MDNIKVTLERNHYFDFLRGIAIMLVVGIHTFLVDEVDMSRTVDWNALVVQSLTCAVPIFLAISGFFLCRKPLDTWSERKAFWKKQIPKVYIPTIIVSLPYLAIEINTGENPVWAFVLMLICGYSIYYFIALILQYYALLPLFQKVSSLGGVILLGIVTLVSVGLSLWCDPSSGVSLPLLVCVGPFPVWCVFFGLGCYLRKTDRGYSLAVPIAFVVIGIILQYAELHWLNRLYGGAAGFGIKISTCVYSVAVILLLFSAKLERAYKRNVISRFVEYVGTVSFTIYLYHCLLARVPVKLGMNGLPWIGRWAAVMSITLVFVEVAKRILPKKTQWLVGITNY